MCCIQSNKQLEKLNMFISMINSGIMLYCIIVASETSENEYTNCWDAWIYIVITINVNLIMVVITLGFLIISKYCNDGKSAFHTISSLIVNMLSMISVFVWGIIVQHKLSDKCTNTYVYNMVNLISISLMTMYVSAFIVVIILFSFACYIINKRNSRRIALIDDSEFMSSINNV